MIPDSNTLLFNINRRTPYLNPALRRIATFIVENPEKIKLLKISQLARKCDVSEATVTRFVKDFKIKNFQELKIILANVQTQASKSESKAAKFVYDDVAEGDSIDAVIEKIACRNMKALEDAKDIVDPTEIEKAVAAIDKSEIITIYCIGTSTIAAESAKMRFYRVGKECIVYNDPANQAVSSSLLGKKRTAIAISNSGKSAPTVNALKMAQKSGAQTICITGSPTSPINRYADIKIYTGANRISFFQESLVSRIAQILIIDILYACYALKHYKKSIRMVEDSGAALARALKY
jgi:DNA-binding MurR/RpiR family transcriptional regulator